MRPFTTRTPKELLRGLILALPGGKKLLSARFRYLEYRRLSRIGDPERIFEHYFNTNEWTCAESVSGIGSTLAYTENIRREIPRLTQAFAVRTILDAPCGDYNWFRMIQWEQDIVYLGGDIVAPLVERNQSLYGSPSVRFIKLDIVHDILPPVDLWLCRDCLFHLSNGDILRVIDNFLRSNIRYLLTTTHPSCTENTDLPTGSFRLLNLQLPPFSFCMPITTIDDWIEGFPIRHLALWDRETLKSSVVSGKLLKRAEGRSR